MHASRQTPLIAAATLALFGGLATTASADWKPVAASAPGIATDVSLARTSDSVLHVGWARNQADVFANAISPTGSVGGAVPVVTGWAQLEPPALVAQGTALSAFMAGSPTTNTNDPQRGLDLATSGDGGSTWSLRPTPVATDASVFGRVPAAVAAGSNVLQAWYGDAETRVHAGLDPRVLSQAGYGDGQNQALAAAADGTVQVAWCNPLPGATGVFAAAVDPATGAPAGAPVQMPQTDSCPAGSRTQLVARPTGGFYIASAVADQSRILVWSVGSASPSVLGANGGGGYDRVALTATPEGRLWVGWSIAGSDKLIFTRSNKTVTRWGAAVTVTVPSGQQPLGLSMDAQVDRTDVVLGSQDTSSATSLWANQVYPGLTLVARGGKKQRFTVLDAGDPVSGATVRVGGRSLTTNGQGVANVDLPKGRYTATASKPRYVSAKAGMTAR